MQFRLFLRMDDHWLIIHLFNFQQIHLPYYATSIPNIMSFFVPTSGIEVLSPLSSNVSLLLLFLNLFVNVGIIQLVEISVLADLIIKGNHNVSTLNETHS